MNSQLSPSLSDFSDKVRQQVDEQLSDLLPEPAHHPKQPEDDLNAAMRYAVLGGGKRVRPLLCFATAHVFCTPDSLFKNSAVLKGACAIELIHAYSLVHDDLPAMDDDDLRRGRPTTHKQFDEATAILAGDALQTLAFSVLTTLADTPDNASKKLSDKAIIKAIGLLAQASGMAGMVGGQAIDISAVGNKLSIDELARMHRMKTGALIKASVLLGAVLSGCEDATQLRALENFAEKIGLAFQIQDDILDCTASTDVLGKQQGADAERDKPTYVSLLGLEGARAKLTNTHEQAVSCLTEFENNGLLIQIADYIVARTN